MQRTNLTFSLALKPIIGLGLASLLCPPLSAQTLPYDGTANSDLTLWRITQTGLGGSGEFRITNATNSNPALFATSNGSEPVLKAIATGTGDGIQGIGSNSNSGIVSNGVYGHAYNSGSGGYFIAQNSGNGVFGQSSRGDGVRGQSFDGYGVEGYNINSGNWGVVGGATYGVSGQGHNNAGVYAYSDTNNGIFAQSDSGYAGYFSGSIYVTGTINGPSDARYKTHVKTLPNALATVLRLRGVSFDWKRDAYKDMHFGRGRQMGFIAQEIEQVLPELVSTNHDGYRSVDYMHVVPILVEAIKQQQKQITILQEQAKQDKAVITENAGLKEHIADQETRLAKLETGQSRRQQSRHHPADMPTSGAFLLLCGVAGTPCALRRFLLRR